MKEIRIDRPGLAAAAASFLACLATILEVPAQDVPDLAGEGDPSADWNVLGWLGSLEVGLVPVADPQEFAWPGPWIARVRDANGERSVVMYGRSPSGVVWDPLGGGPVTPDTIVAGFVLAAEDVALGMPQRAAAPSSAGRVEVIWVADHKGERGRMLQAVNAVPGVGLEGDRYVTDQGTFPAGRPGAALTLIEAEVCESFSPPLEPDEHRRNLVTRGIRLNGLVGREFTIGGIRCRGIRLCEPCATMQRYSGREILRPLVHRGGLRVDLLEAGQIHTGDALVPLEPAG